MLINGVKTVFFGTAKGHSAFVAFNGQRSNLWTRTGVQWYRSLNLPTLVFSCISKALVIYVGSLLVQINSLETEEYPLECWLSHVVAIVTLTQYRTQSNIIPLDPNTVWEGTANPLNHTSVVLPKNVLGSIGCYWWYSWLIKLWIMNG